MKINDRLEILYGAVTLGDIWKFGTLDRNRQHFVKNIHSHTIPEQTEDVFSIKNLFPKEKQRRLE